MDTREEDAGRPSMTVVAGTAALDRSLGRVVTVVGVFDGLHRGHDYLLRELRRVAVDRTARPMVITFDHHPDEILKGAAPPLLCDPAERMERLAAAGVEVTVIETFDRATRETPYDVWVRRIADRVDLAGFLMTPESAFGHNRGGAPATVAALGRELGYDVEVVPQFALDGEPVRSSDIRAAIADGDLGRAERLLGRPVSVTGIAAPTGEALALRFPMPVALPAGGRYRVDVSDDGRDLGVAAARIDGLSVLVEPGPPVDAGSRVRLTFRAS